MNKKFLVATLVAKLLWVLVPGLAVYGIVVTVPADLVDGVETPAEYAAMWPVLGSAVAAGLRQLWKHRAKLRNGLQWARDAWNLPAAGLLILVGPGLLLGGCGTMSQGERLEMLAATQAAVVQTLQASFEVYAANEALQAQLGAAEFERMLLARQARLQEAVVYLEYLERLLAEKHGLKEAGAS